MLTQDLSTSRPTRVGPIPSPVGGRPVALVGVRSQPEAAGSVAAEAIVALRLRHMGLDAQVIAIGPFSNDALSCLEYGATHYAEVEQGATVVTNLFIACTSEASHALAKAFGVGAMELGKHHLNPTRTDTALLREHFGDGDVASFERLAEHGFQFYYLPNA